MPGATDAQDLHKAYGLHQQGHTAEASKIYRRLIAANPKNYHALHFLAAIEAGNGNAEAAKALMARSLAIRPPNVAFIENYAALSFNTGDYALALETCRQGLRSSPNNAQLLHVAALSLYKLGRAEEALGQFDRLVALHPTHAAGVNERGSVLAEMKQYDAALACFEKALALDPRHAPALLNIGNVYFAWHRTAEALEAFGKALVLQPGLAEAWHGCGNVLCELRRYDEALAAYDKAIALGRDFAKAWHGRGDALNHLDRHGEAAESYARALAIEPQFEFAKGLRLHEKMLCCDWDGIDRLVGEIESDIEADKFSAEPFGWLALSHSEKSLQKCAELYAQKRFPAQPAIAHPPRIHSGDKIRVGYLSGEFRAQATSFLLVGVLERHDREKFEVYAIDNGDDDQSETRRRVADAVHGVVAIKHLTDAEAAARIYENEIDILVNLNGYFGEGRMDVFAHRPAPIQVNFLGFPGTLGARYIDYVVADRMVIPESNAAFFTEKVVTLPHCYQPNDRSRPIAADVPSRVSQGLPEHGFVFCCFNNNFKINPSIFDIWMRVLAKTERSVLWLLEDSAAAAANLRQHAEARGIAAERLVFAPRQPLADHLARHGCADLFLDTTPYGAHTTASDALWAGLPVLTALGATFASRVAASLLTTIGLPELVAADLDTYADLAVALAADRARLIEIRAKLKANRLTTPLFDSALFARHIEAAYAAMMGRLRVGLPPDQIEVPNA